VAQSIQKRRQSEHLIGRAQVRNQRRLQAVRNVHRGFAVQRSVALAQQRKRGFDHTELGAHSQYKAFSAEASVIASGQQHRFEAVAQCSLVFMKATEEAASIECDFLEHDTRQAVLVAIEQCEDTPSDRLFQRRVRSSNAGALNAHKFFVERAAYVGGARPNGVGL